VDVGFEAYVLARGDALHRTAYLLTHDHALAEDLVQTALARSWRSWARIHGEPDPYVRKVMMHTYASWWRRRWNGERPVER
jgi:DNA-directed RNA polymerase specialized sigma24 family protein